ncbi:hypothetical protein VNO77_02138 [Canavalia gladiata]|uniref:Uncharacterized protein n=1 Tax=Canavalia gladiata TaxID=3824 RepID=A0AAN9MXL3_CANGL
MDSGGERAMRMAMCVEAVAFFVNGLGREMGNSALCKSPLNQYYNATAFGCEDDEQEVLGVDHQGKNSIAKDGSNGDNGKKGLASMSAEAPGTYCYFD